MTTAPAPLRTRFAARLGREAAALSRRVGRGDGTVIGGRVTLLADPAALSNLGRGRWIALVSGTNGKTTTTRLLTAALATRGPVVTNPQGSNLPPGLVTGLAGAAPGVAAALEVDEGWLGIACEALTPAVVCLLNLSRDQLDRVAEVRRIADKWRRALASTPATRVVANADDPLVVWAAGDAAHVDWVAAGQPWHQDAVGCPACAGRIAFDGDGWACTACTFRRPVPGVQVKDGALVTERGSFPVRLSLPGRANVANAVMAATAARAAGIDEPDALAAMATTTQVDGRYRDVDVAGARARILLAKNPAGWLEVFDMLAPPPQPVVVVINARIADGRDPSWLWDVPFERLEGRPVAASGERARDLAVRLRYAGLDVRRVADPVEAIAGFAPGAVDVAANYTAMRDLDRRLRARG